MFLLFVLLHHSLTFKLTLNGNARLNERAGKQIKKQTALNHFVSLYEKSKVYDMQLVRRMRFSIIIILKSAILSSRYLVLHSLYLYVVVKSAILPGRSAMVPGRSAMLSGRSAMLPGRFSMLPGKFTRLIKLLN